MINRKLCISGTGKYLPKKVVLSCELDKKFCKKEGWVEKKSGVVKRHFANPDETTTFMALQACKQALNNANLLADDIDCIIGACGVMEQAIPNTSTLLSRELGLAEVGISTFDINTTCLSFLSAFDVASYMVNVRRFKNVLIFSSDIPSLGLNWKHIESCTIFGDGAAAAIVAENSKENSINVLASHFETYSNGSSLCQIQAGGTKLHPSRFKEDLGKYALFEMDGKAAYRLSSKALDSFLERFLARTNIPLKDIDYVIPHQASKLAMHYLLKKIGIPKDKLIDIYPNHGNQVAASIPTALHEWILSGRAVSGCKVLLLGTSAGISIGGVLLEYS